VASAYQARQLRRLGARQIHVIPASGVAIARSVPDRVTARRTLGWNGTPVVGYLGHFSPAKGVHTLIDAFYERNDTPATLVLAYSGKGKLPAKQDRRLAELCATGRATLMGVVDPLVFLAACDVTVLPYLTSSIYHLPQVLLESFAAGTVVISTSVGGIGELVVPAQTGRLVPPGDHHALGSAMVESLTNLDAAHSMGRHAREVFEQQLSTEVFCTRFERLLHHGLN
jgi:rhamnosyl/mannosyltransferase